MMRTFASAMVCAGLALAAPAGAFATTQARFASSCIVTQIYLGQHNDVDAGTDDCRSPRATFEVEWVADPNVRSCATVIRPFGWKKAERVELAYVGYDVCADIYAPSVSGRLPTWTSVAHILSTTSRKSTGMVVHTFGHP